MFTTGKLGSFVVAGAGLGFFTCDAKCAAGMLLGISAVRFSILKMKNFALKMEKFALKYNDLGASRWRRWCGRWCCYRSCSKMCGFILNMMDFILYMMDFVPKMMDGVLTMIFHQTDRTVEAKQGLL